MVLEDIVKKYTINGRLDAPGFVESVIDECIFAFLLNYDGIIDPLNVKQVLLEHYGIVNDTFIYDPLKDLDD